MKKFLAGLATGLLLVGMVGTAHAETIFPQSNLISSTEYYTNNLGDVAVMTGGGSSSNVGGSSGRNDDGFMGPINLGFDLDFFGVTYNSFYANNNGNISFNNGISAYVPTGPLGAVQPIISPFFADVDTRTSAGVMYVQNDVANQWVITWDQVGYFNSHATPTNSFQLVLRGSDYVVPEGEGTIGFFYRDMGWDTTDTSTTAAVGFGNGSGDGVVLQGSNTSGMAAVVANHHTWFVQQGGTIVVVDNNVVPEPSTIFLLGFGLLGLAGASRKKMKK